MPRRRHDLLESQDLGALEPRQPLGRHAVLAAEVAAVGDRYAQVPDLASVTVDERVALKRGALKRGALKRGALKRGAGHDPEATLRR